MHPRSQITRPSKEPKTDRTSAPPPGRTDNTLCMISDGPQKGSLASGVSAERRSDRFVDRYTLKWCVRVRVFCSMSYRVCVVFTSCSTCLIRSHFSLGANSLFFVRILWTSERCLLSTHCRSNANRWFLFCSRIISSVRKPLFLELETDEGSNRSTSWPPFSSDWIIQSSKNGSNVLAATLRIIQSTKQIDQRE